MINGLNLHVNTFGVLQDLQHEFRLHSPISRSWEGGWIHQSGEARLVRRDPTVPKVDCAKWGKTLRDGGITRTDDRSPEGVCRGLLPAAGLQMIVPNEAQPWFQKSFYVSKADGKAMMIGCSWQTNPDTGVLEFAILTNTAGPDLAGNFSKEPVIVPQVMWTEWLDQSSKGSLFYPTRPGTFAVEQR